MKNSELDAKNLQEIIARQQQIIDSQTAQISQKDRQLESKDKTINLLEEKLRLAVIKRFGPSTEKYNVEQKDMFFDEAEQEVEDESVEQTEGITVPAHTRKKPGRVALPKDLPRERVVHDLSDEDKVCDKDGHALHVIGEEVTEQLEIIPAKIKVIAHVKLKYGCRHCEQTIKTAKAPKNPIPKSIASPKLLAYVAVSKYQDALPLYRQENILKRYGVDLPRATLANWMIKCGELLTPIINLLNDQLLSGPLIHMDETPVQVLKEPDKKAQSKSYMWVRVGGLPDKPVRLFDYSPSRSGQVPVDLLQDHQGFLLTDAYDGYNAIIKQNNLTPLACWAHVRRKFDEALKAQKKKTGKAQMAISYIQKLYRIERDIRHESPEHKKQQRQEKAKPILDDIKKWMEKSIPNVLPQSLLGKALNYMLKLWPRLTAYADHGETEIDNNPAENAIRPFAVGRKNWLFAQSVKGVKASATLYSIIETAKANDLEPFDYLTHLFEQIPNVTTIDDFEKLLPWNCEVNVG